MTRRGACATVTSFALRATITTVAAVAMFVLSGCQTQPTRVRDNLDRKFDNAGVMLTPIKIQPETVLIDSRSPFEFSVAHVPRSISMQWMDFTETEPDFRGILLSDQFALARRLATRGVAPDSQVIVIGRGLGGDGEEGRLAWTLAYLGVTNVQFTTLEALRARVTNIVEDTQSKSVPVWKPEPIESLNVTRAELLFVINNLGTTQPVSYRSGDPALLYKIVDVRSEGSYLGREGYGAQHKVPNMDAINIPWKEFFDPGLRPRADIVKRLNAIGVSTNHRILVIDEEGVASGAATMALRALGFSRAGNVAGGLKELMSSYGR